MNQEAVIKKARNELYVAITDVLNDKFDGKVAYFTFKELAERVRLNSGSAKSEQTCIALVANLFDASWLSNQGWHVEVTSTGCMCTYTKK